jgi:branched-chain amino acid transport system substrate-binding protein
MSHNNKRCQMSLVSVLVFLFAIASPFVIYAGSVKLGTVVGFTGFMAMDGPDCVKGIEFKLEEMDWQVEGKKIELIKEDGASVVNTYVDKAMKLVNSDKVDAVLGPLFSPGAFAIANYLKKSGTPNINFMMNDKKILGLGGNNVLLHWGTLEGTGYYMGIYAYENLGYRSATAIWPDNQSGEGLSQGFIKGFELKGGKIVQIQRVPANTMDYSPYLTRMKKADFTLFWQFGPFVAPFMKQFQDMGRKMPVIMPLNTPAGAHVLKEAGDAALGYIGIGPYTPSIKTSINQKFVKAFHKKHGVYPRAEHVGGYIAAAVVLEGIKTTGGDTTPRTLINAIKSNRVNTPAGVISYTDKGLGVGDLYIQKVVKKGDQYVWDMIDKYSQVVFDVPKK